MDEILITLEGLLKVIESPKPLTINLFNESDLLLITFVLPGYPCLDDFLCDDEVLKVKIKNINTLDVYIDTSKNE